MPFRVSFSEMILVTTVAETSSLTLPFNFANTLPANQVANAGARNPVATSMIMAPNSASCLAAAFIAVMFAPHVSVNAVNARTISADVSASIRFRSPGDI